MKNYFVLAVILAIGFVIWLLLGKKEATQVITLPSPTNGTTITATRQSAPPFPAGESRGEGENSIQSNTPAVTESTNDLTLIRTNLHSLIPAPEDAAPVTPALPSTTVLDNARVLIHNYAAQFGENPVGDNAEITAALTGNNPKQANFLRADSGLRVNDKGEMIDTYSTPFFFHQLSAQLMEIRSAGKDRKLWTLDDQVTR